MEKRIDWHTLWQTFKSQFIVLGAFVFLFWALELIDWAVFRGGMDMLGIAPRSVEGMRGIVLAPFLHVGFGHVAANTIPFIVLGWLTMLRSLREFALVSIIVAFISGLGTWVIAPSNSVHLGASGLIFGFFGYLILRGYFERSWQSILAAVFVLLVYGTMVFGIFPNEVGVSWQMHLFGLAGGGLAAYFLAKRPQPQPKSRSIEDEIRLGT